LYTNKALKTSLYLNTVSYALSKVMDKSQNGSK